MTAPKTIPRTAKSFHETEEALRRIAEKIDHQGTTVALLGQTISNPPTQAEVQAISDKLDAVIGVLKKMAVIS